MAVLLAYGTFGRSVEQPAPVSAQVRTIVDGLRTTSVYEAPGAPGKIDAARARQLIGDRPIVLVLLGTEPLPPSDDEFTQPGQDLCEQIAAVVTTSLVIVYAIEKDGRYGPSYCVGPEFSNPQNPVDAGNYDFQLIARAEVAWQYRVTEADLFPQVEEFVFAFDEQAAQDYPNGVPRRAPVIPPPPTPDTLQTWQIILSLAGILVGTIALFVALRLVGRLVVRRGARDAETRHRSEATSARLNKLADRILHPPAPKDAADARRQADLAGEYVLVLGEFEAATTPAGLAGVNERLDELEEAAT
ncbi:hypothetical protein [Actinophytocola sp.]|uniref:hypothetical protein n=1 Tax=Actinophytocola sp. TaxID=1872138 RepID=UPI002ED6AD65